MSQLEFELVLPALPDEAFRGRHGHLDEATSNAGTGIRNFERLTFSARPAEGHQ